MAILEAHEESISYLDRLWNSGQQHLVLGRYIAARRDLEAAEAVAWRQRDPLSLARIYLPLLEARRQIRQNATDGVIVIAHPHDSRAEHQLFSDFTKASAGTLLVVSPHAGKLAGSITYAAQRTGACLDTLLLLEHAQHTRICSPADPHFAAGLDVRFTTTPTDMIAPDVLTDAIIPLPPVGTYISGHPLHAVARESLVVAWEALALKWQARHPARAQPWEELAWLRLALRIDPAAEPIAMRLMALAEAISRQPSEPRA